MSVNFTVGGERCKQTSFSDCCSFMWSFLARKRVYSRICCPQPYLQVAAAKAYIDHLMSPKNPPARKCPKSSSPSVRSSFKSSSPSVKVLEPDCLIGEGGAPIDKPAIHHVVAK